MHSLDFYSIVGMLIFFAVGIVFAIGFFWFLMNFIKYELTDSSTELKR